MRYIDSGLRDPSQALGTWIQTLNPSDVIELRFQTGFFGIAGIALLRPVLERLRERNGITRCLIGSNDSGTSGLDVGKLVEALGLPREGANLSICAFGNAFFHPKVVHIRRADGSEAAYVGSANLTEPGVGGRHIEAGILLDTADGDSPEEIKKIAAAVDAWFDSIPSREGCFPVKGQSAVEDLMEIGILASEADSEENRPPSRKSPKGTSPELPTLSPLVKLPTTRAGTGSAPEIPSDSAQSPAPAPSPVPNDVAAGATFFIREVSKGRGDTTIQADLGTDAFFDFFPGDLSQEVFVDVTTVSLDGTRGQKESRKLFRVNPSGNYRLGGDFQSAYPEDGVPIVTFRKLTTKEFLLLLLLPGDLGYTEAAATLTSFAKPVNPPFKRLTFLTSNELTSTWPKCPLL